MKNSGVGYLVKEGFKNVFYNRMLSFTSVGVLTACLFLVGFAYMFYSNVSVVLDWVGNNNIINVYLKDNLSQAQKEEVSLQIKNNPNVLTFEYISKEQGLDEYKQKVKNGDVIFNGLEKDNPLPDSFRVKVKSINSFSQTVEQFKSIPNVDTISEHTEIAELLIGVCKAVTTVSILMVSLLLIISLFIISNTIKVAMFERRLEIHIMKYVGATDGFIRLPFVVEGTILGAISGIISVVLVGLCYKYTFPYFLKLFSNPLSFSPIPFSKVAFGMASGFIVFGIITGIFASLMSMRKYLKA
jgi:cell division transport system permease protein